jgi:hypothetical protein
MAPRSGAARVTERYATCAPNRSPAPTRSTGPCGTAARTVAANCLCASASDGTVQWPCVCCSVVPRGFTHPHGSHPPSSSSASENVSPVRSAVSSSALRCCSTAKSLVTAYFRCTQQQWSRASLCARLSPSRCSLSHCLWQVYVWDTTSRNLLYKLPGHRGSVNGTESLQH